MAAQAGTTPTLSTRTCSRKSWRRGWHGLKRSSRPPRILPPSRVARAGLAPSAAALRRLRVGRHRRGTEHPPGAARTPSIRRCTTTRRGGRGRRDARTSEQTLWPKTRESRTRAQFQPRGDNLRARSSSPLLAAQASDVPAQSRQRPPRRPGRRRPIHQMPPATAVLSVSTAEVPSSKLRRR